MRIKTLEKETKFLKRLYFIRYRYYDDSVKTAGEKVVVYKMVAYHWQDRWNKGGYDGIVPRFA
jgi:transposase